MKYEFVVKLDKWTSPIKVIAPSALEAKKLALKQYPKCDCCEDKTRVEYVNYIDALITVQE